MQSENADSNIDKYKTKPCTYVNVKKYYIC